MPDGTQALESVQDATAVINGDARAAATPATRHASDEQVTAPKLRRPTVLAAVALALLGAGAFGAGVAAVFVTDNETGAAALLVAGTALVVLGRFGHRLKILRYKDLAFELYEEAHAAARRGDVARARAQPRRGPHVQPGRANRRLVCVASRLAAAGRRTHNRDEQDLEAGRR